MPRRLIEETILLEAMQDIRSIPKYRRSHGDKLRLVQLARALERIRTTRREATMRLNKQRTKEEKAIGTNPHVPGTVAYANWNAMARGRQQYLALQRQARKVHNQSDTI
jgi:hypothetical protein